MHEYNLIFWSGSKSKVSKQFKNVYITEECKINV